MSLNTTGFNASTAKNLLLDAGAVYKNFDKINYTGTLIGATQGGNQFRAVPNMRNIPIDGVKSEYVRGLTVIDSWEVSLTTNLLEVTRETLKLALGAIEEASTADGKYYSIKGKQYLYDNDYLDNVAYVGKISGSKQPVIVIVKNAMNHGGLEISMEDASEGVLPVTLHGHQDSSDLDNPPFEILYPKVVINSATVAPNTFAVAAAPAGGIDFTITSDGAAECIGVKLGAYALATTEFDVTAGTVTIEKAYLDTLAVGDHIFALIMDVGNDITAPKIIVTSI